MPIQTFDQLPDSAYIREAQLVRSPKRPGVPVPLPFSGAKLWRMVKAQTFPAPIKLSDRVTAWKVGDVRCWLRSIAGEAPPPLKTPIPKPAAHKLRNAHLKAVTT